jgi:tRNA threonylcarbamoyladenosine biosynthesis protein TsaE
MRIVSNSSERTRTLGETLGRLLAAGDVVALIGELGSGKTVLAQGLARGLGIDADEYVSSPSFALVNQYRGKIPVYHIDTYRLGDAVEMVALGYEDYFEPNGVTIIEWADKVKDLLPARCLVITIDILDRTSRELKVEFAGEWPVESVARIEAALAADAAKVY